MFESSLEQFNLLKHKFYIAWENGQLTKKDLQEYTCQYFNHVNEFPRYLSAIHTNCNDIKTRQVLLDNLIDEERGEENHPALWLKFANAIDVDNTKVQQAKLSDKVKKLSKTFFRLANGSLAEGLGALYAYERQVSEVAKTKIASLKKLYGISDENTLKFFTVHITADEWHAEECEDLIKNLNNEDKENAKLAAVKLAKCLWEFLDDMEEMRISKQYYNF